MTPYERAHWELIQRVMKKWVDGPARKKYTFANREADREILKRVEKKLEL